MSVTGGAVRDRAFAVLRAVATSAGGVSDIARRTGLAVSTTAGCSARSRGWAPSTRHEPGSDVPHRPRRDRARCSGGSGRRAWSSGPAPTSRCLSPRWASPPGISVADGDRHVLYLDQVDGDQDVTLRDWTGEQLPLHVVSSGLVLLADRDDAAVTAYRAMGSTRFTEHTVTRPPSSDAGSAGSRSTGYVWTVEEYVDGHHARLPRRSAMPPGRVVAALHVHGPSYRLKPSNRRVTTAIVAAAARM